MSNGDIQDKVFKRDTPGSIGDDVSPPLIGVTSDPSAAGVAGFNRSKGPGVLGESDAGGPGVSGFSRAGDGIVGRSNAANHSGVWADNAGGGHGVTGTSDAPGGVGVFGRGAKLAGQFEGNVSVIGNVTARDVVLDGGDCAEDFDIASASKMEAGTVMVINETGSLQESQQAYDRRVVGVISGADGCKPGLVLARQHSQINRMPIALIGRVYCKADAGYSPIGVGDMLTSSPTPGHAMKAMDAQKAFGAVVGKALRPLCAGKGLIPILIALQ